MTVNNCAGPFRLVRRGVFGALWLQCTRTQRLVYRLHNGEVRK